MMMRMIAGAFAALLLVASPALAQLTSSDLNQQATNAGVNFETDSASDIDAAISDTLQADILAASGVAGATSLEDLTDDQIAAAIGSIIGNSPTLTNNQALALVRAAIKAKPSAVVKIAAAAAYARPAMSADFKSTAIAAVPAQTNAITAAVVKAAVAGVEADTNEDGFVDEVENNENPNQDASPD